jgi:hypothetical protein
LLEIGPDLLSVYVSLSLGGVNDLKTGRCAKSA